MLKSANAACSAGESQGTQHGTPPSVPGPAHTVTVSDKPQATRQVISQVWQQNQSPESAANLLATLHPSLHGRCLGGRVLEVLDEVKEKETHVDAACRELADCFAGSCNCPA